MSGETISESPFSIWLRERSGAEGGKGRKDPGGRSEGGTSVCDTSPFPMPKTKPITRRTIRERFTDFLLMV
jgi:hypothetical protein